MRLQLTVLMTLCMLMIGGHAALAADEEGSYAVRGSGAQSCTKFLEQLNEDEQRSAVVSNYASWTLGYLSHANRTAENIFDISPITSPRELLSLAISVCRENREVRFETAFAGVLDTLRKGAIEKESPLMRVNVGDRVTMMRQTTVIDMQRRLKEQGILEGPVDGIYGQKTIAAVQAFQEQNDIDGGGFPTAATIIQLVIANGS